MFTRDLILKGLHESRVMADDYPEMAFCGIQMIGITRVITNRTRWSRESEREFSHLHITISGEAKCLVKGRWVSLPARSVYMVPPGADWAWRYEAEDARPWEGLFVRLQSEFRSPLPVGQERAYMIRDCDPTDLQWTFQQLYRESLAKGRPTVITNLSEMIAHFVRELIDENEHHYRLSNLWMSVSRDLARHWDIDSLCRETAMSQEKLRLLSHKETGKSPIAQVTHLRMRQAADLLGEAELSVQQIANMVGYENPFNFSLAFKRLYGLSPSHFRKKQLSDG